MRLNTAPNTDHRFFGEKACLYLEKKRASIFYNTAAKCKSGGPVYVYVGGEGEDNVRAQFVFHGVYTGASSEGGDTRHAIAALRQRREDATLFLGLTLKMVSVGTRHKYILKLFSRQSLSLSRSIYFLIRAFLLLRKQLLHNSSVFTSPKATTT